MHLSDVDGYEDYSLLDRAFQSIHYGKDMEPADKAKTLAIYEGNPFETIMKTVYFGSVEGLVGAVVPYKYHVDQAKLAKPLEISKWEAKHLTLNVDLPKGQTRQTAGPWFADQRSIDKIVFDSEKEGLAEFAAPGRQDVSLLGNYKRIKHELKNLYPQVYTDGSIRREK